MRQKIIPSRLPEPHETAFVIDQCVYELDQDTREVILVMKVTPCEWDEDDEWEDQ